MKIKTELLKRAVTNIINSYIEDIFEIDADTIANTVAIKLLGEIQKIIQSDDSDFDKVEKIVCLFEDNKISAGGCHDFG